MTTTPYDHQILKSHAFGDLVVRRTYKHPDTRETVADVKVISGAESGTVLHLSIAYCNRLIGEQK